MGSPPRRIVLVDDHEDTRELTEEVLGSEGFEIVSMEDAPEALRAVREQCPDVLLTDLTLPSMTGEELAAQVRSDPKLAGIIIVAMSGRDVAGNVAHLFDKIVRKPIDLMALAAELKKM